MAKWARNPPSWTRVKLFFGIAVLCLALYAVERWIDLAHVQRIQALRTRILDELQAIAPRLAGR